MYHYPFIYRYIPKGTRTILDVGTGWGFLGLFAQRWFPASDIQIDGIEKFSPLAERNRSLYRRIWNADALDVLQILPDKSYDVVVCTDVIEHMERGGADKVIRECERVGRRVILSSANSFYRNNIDKEELEGNPFQQHECLIPVRDARRMGYKCVGTGRIFNVGMDLFHRIFARHFENWIGYKDTPEAD